ncbi:MAG: response regulator [Aquabacterium sp.]|nr:response regulator [Aquabacterium sp.]
MPDAGSQLASLGESLTALVRTMQPTLKEQGCVLYFDYLGLTTFAIQDVQAMVRCARSMVDIGLREAQSGHGVLFLTVHARPLSMDKALVTIRLAYTLTSGERDLDRLSTVSTPSATSVLQECLEMPGMDRLALLDAFNETAEPACTHFLSPNEGALIELRLSLPHAGADTEPTSLRELATASAWLISPSIEDGILLAERLQRDGWLVRQFADIDDALRFWRSSDSRLEPALVVAIDQGLTGMETLLAARRAWSSQCRVVYGVHADIGLQDASPDVEIRKLPFSPADLRELKDIASALEAVRKAHPHRHQRGDAAVRPIALVVDDSPINRILATEMLQLLGYDCDTANNGEEAVEYVARYRPDAILMDLEMPVMDGMEATERIRRYEMHGAGLHAPIPIIASTARDEPDVSSSWEAIGMSAFVPKPLMMGRLAAALSVNLPDPPLSP